MSKFLVTAALPYANGPLHFGHLAGAYIPADVYVKHKKLLGEKTIFICGSDEHGVAIMLNANKAKKDYKEYVDAWHKEHEELFKSYDIDFDFFGQTSAPYHKDEVIRWFNELYQKGFIGTKDEQQLYCEDCHNWLPDRFVEGTCYNCGYESARGDECPNCGIWVEATKLKNPVCKICGSHNIKEKTVTQYYLLLSKFHKEFRKWFETKEATWRKTVYPFVDALSKEELHDRAISRDLDWGIDVPLAEAKGKKLYVWFDAPIGYLSNTKEFLRQSGSSEDYIKDWWKNDDTVITNFIGKDNIIFHGIIFPVMSMASGLANPVTNLPANQYVNLVGKQFSKSTGHYIDAKKALEDFGSDALRYYLISLIPETNDSSFTWTNFAAKVNNELANNIGNLANRCLKFFNKNWHDGIEGDAFMSFFESDAANKLKEDLIAHKGLLDSVSVRKGLEAVMAMGTDANTFFSDRAPWAQMKVDEAAAKETIANTTVFIAVLAIALSPYLPKLSKTLLSYFKPMDHDLMSRVYKGDVDALKDFFKDGMTLQAEPTATVPKIDEKLIASLEEELANK